MTHECSRDTWNDPSSKIVRVLRGARTPEALVIDLTPDEGETFVGVTEAHFEMLDHEGTALTDWPATFVFTDELLTLTHHFVAGDTDRARQVTAVPTYTMGGIVRRGEPVQVWVIDERYW